jgi:aspartyl protease family protein
MSTFGGGQPDNDEEKGTSFSPQPSILLSDPRRQAARSASVPLTKIVALGALLLILLLPVMFLKGMSSQQLDLLKGRVRAAKTSTAPAPTVQKSPSQETSSPSDSPASTQASEPANIAAPVYSTPAIPESPIPAGEPQGAAPQLAELVLSPAPNGNFYVKGQINGQEVIFVVDTGASAVSIPDSLRWKLNLTRGRYLQSATANGIAGMYETQVKNLSIGPLRLKDVQAVLNPNAPDNTVLLGMTALREVRMVQQDGHMLLQQEIHPDTADEPSVSSPSLKLKKSAKDCMGTDKIINDRVLKCMQGAEDEVEAEQQTE